jgi:hypothetical protein
MDAPFPDAMMPDIAKFFREVHPTLKPGRGVYDEVFRTELFFPLQRKRELAKMLEVARGTGEPCAQCGGDGGNPVNDATCSACIGTGHFGPRVVMEIGADKGGGLYHWCMMPSVRTVIASEIRGTPYMHLFEEAFPDIQFYWVQSSSYNATNVYRVLQFLGKRKLDVLFIDGDKAGMLRDFEAYHRMVDPAGVIFMHDVRDAGGPREAFATVKRRGFRTEHVVDVSEYEELEAARQYHVSYLPELTSWQQWLLHWKGRSCTVGVVYPN